MIYKIYKIECLTTGKIYIGQTRNKVKNRIGNHISTFNKFCGCDYCYSHEVLLNNNFTIEIIDEVDCCYYMSSSDYFTYDTETAKYNAKLPNNLEAFYMNYFKSINGTHYCYGCGSKEKRRQIQEKKSNERKNVEKIKYHYNNIKTNILNSEEVEEFKNQYLNNDECYNNIPSDITRKIEY